MLNNIGLPGFVLLILLAVAIYFFSIRPAARRAKLNSTNVMYEISPAFWIVCGVVLAGLGIALYSYITDPALVRQAMWSGANPLAVQKTLGNIRLVSIIAMVVGGIFFMVGIARSVLVSRSSE